ncbi:MAG TPA: ATP-binding cassette domain-containing protein [Polyangiaceae bacterium]|nr:ATP-binding cassette domain-containing protein [Polyangiaceae bacterium]
MSAAVLETHGVGVAFVASSPVLHDVKVSLRSGWTGLVGANGAGKTTLLRVLAGELSPTEGRVSRRPSDAVLVHCPQDVAEIGSDVMAFAEELTELHARLGLDPGALGRWATLSPGERKRWQIGAALAREPDILLLDEPTNHLDGSARRLLVAALRRFRGVGVLVSHDRALLDELPRSILRVHDARVTSYEGGYSDALRAWSEQRRAAEEEHVRAKTRARDLAVRLDDVRREQAAADRGRNAGTRMKGPRDHDARGGLAKGLAEFAEARAGRTVGVVRAELARAEREIPRIERDPTLGAEIFARYERAHSAVLLHVDADELGVLRDVRITIGREERVRIAGDNGAGKTTLLSALVASRPDRILYLPQELDDVGALMGTLRELGSEERGRVLSVFAALGSDPARIAHRRDPTLSPGEARKLALSLGLGRHVWALVLDEPTNHLDLPSTERLERALEGYPGAIVLVTHDDRFASATTTRSLVVRDGIVR